MTVGLVISHWSLVIAVSFYPGIAIISFDSLKGTAQLHLMQFFLRAPAEVRTTNNGRRNTFSQSIHSGMKKIRNFAKLKIRQADTIQNAVNGCDFFKKDDWWSGDPSSLLIADSS